MTKVEMTDFICSSLINELDRLQPLKSIPKPLNISNKKRNIEGLSLVSDLQVGHMSKTFNADILRRRMEKLTREVISKVNIDRKTANISKINIALLGDIVHGEKIGRTINLEEMEITLKHQMFDVAIPLLAKYITTIAQHVEYVDVFCAWGNHGQAEKYNSKLTNWDLFIYEALKIYFKDNPRIKFTISDDFYMITEIKGQRVMLTHGNAFRGALPYAGINKKIHYWLESLGHFNYLFMGHFHSIFNLDISNSCSMFCNGTFVTDDEWVLENIGFTGSCKQLYITFSHNRLEDIRQIYLGD